MAEGWIKIYRKSLDHWLYNEYRPLTKREAWENMLIWANYADSSCLIKGQLVECKRGQLIYSIETYANKFVWSVGQVRSFFELLRKDKMITIEGMKYTTRLTICNYDEYQDTQRTDNELTANCQRTKRKLKTNSERTDNELTTTREESKESKESKEEEEKNKKKEQIKLIKQKQILRIIYNSNKDLKKYSLTKKKKYVMFIKWIEENTNQVNRMKEPFSIKEYLTLADNYKGDLVQEKLMAMHNQPQITKKYVSAYKTCSNWCKMALNK